jgi:hypothetical protein
MVQMRENVVPVIESYGVDLVLSGHSHVYERTWPIRGHYGFSTTFSETNKVDASDGKPDGIGAYLRPPDGSGTIYLTAAVGGQPRDLLPGTQHPAHLLKTSGVLGSILMDVDGNRLDLQYLNTSGVVQDSFTLIKGEAGAPKLYITTINGLTTVAWPTTAETFDLWYGERLDYAGSWRTITNGITTIGGFNQFQFNTATNGPAGFFRLKQR